MPEQNCWNVQDVANAGEFYETAEPLSIRNGDAALSLAYILRRRYDAVQVVACNSLFHIHTFRRVARV